jgi:hypothetical protein
MDSAELSEAVIVHASRKGKKHFAKKKRKKGKSASLIAGDSLCGSLLHCHTLTRAQVVYNYFAVP